MKSGGFNFRKTSKNFDPKAKTANIIESKQPPKTAKKLWCGRRTFYPFSCVDAKHLSVPFSLLKLRFQIYPA